MPMAKSKRPKPPQVNAAEQAKIEAFLAFHDRNFTDNIKAYKGTKAYRETEMLTGQVEYWQSACSLLKWLRSINAARKPTSRAKKSAAA